MKYRMIAARFLPLLMCLALILAAIPEVYGQEPQESELGAGPEAMLSATDTTVVSQFQPVETVSNNSPTQSDYSYVSHIFTVADVVFFSYSDGTMMALYDSSGSLLWNNSGNPLNKGGYAYVRVSEGVYTAKGSEKFAVLSGDPITRNVVGYYAVDQNGYGVSTEFYTWVPTLYGHCSFIVFAYQDDTQVRIAYTDTGAVIADVTLNKGECWRIKTLSAKWLHVTSNKPVSALTCYDQGYSVPSSNGKWSGTEFYTYVSDIAGWGQDLTVVAYNDNTSVTIEDSETGIIVWSGVLQSGEARVQSYPNGADKFFTVTSDNTVTVTVAPWVTYTSNYHQGRYVTDSTGTRIGTDLIGSTLNGGYLYILAYKDNTSVVIYDSRSGAFVASHSLDNGEYIEANPGNGLWRIMSNYPVSAYSGWGQWNACFAPVQFREVTKVNVETSVHKAPDELYGVISYSPGEPISLRTAVTDTQGYPIYPLETSYFRVFVNDVEAVTESILLWSPTEHEITIRAPDQPGEYVIRVDVATLIGSGSDTQSIVVPKPRKALVVGITEWKKSVVPSEGDLVYHRIRLARFVSEVFRKLGFEVTELIDDTPGDGDLITYKDVSQAIKDFKSTLGETDVAALYMNTHGKLNWFGKFAMAYGDGLYWEERFLSDDPWRSTITEQVDDIGPNLDFLWLDVCHSWAFRDKIPNLGAGGIIFFGYEDDAVMVSFDDDGEWWTNDVIYQSVVGGSYRALVAEDEIARFENEYNVRGVEIIEKDENTGEYLIEVYLTRKKYLERSQSDFNFLFHRLGYEDHGFISQLDHYPAPNNNEEGMDLTDPFLVHQSEITVSALESEPEPTTIIALANIDYAPFDSDNDGLDDSVTMSWDTYTTLPEEDVFVVVEVYDSSNHVVNTYVRGPYTIYADSQQTSSVTFHAEAADLYTAELSLFHASLLLCDMSYITDLSLHERAIEDENETGFSDVLFTTTASTYDNNQYTINVSWKVDTIDEQDITVLLLADGRVLSYGPYTVSGSQANPGEIEFYVGTAGTYYMNLCLIGTGSRLEDLVSLEVPVGTTHFTDVYDDFGSDTDHDGTYDYLAVDVGVAVAAPDYYMLICDLYDQDGSFVATATTVEYLTHEDQFIRLNFSGQEIYGKGKNGPYELRYLQLLGDRGGASLGHRARPYTTAAYQYTDFRAPPAVLQCELSSPLEVVQDEIFNVRAIVTNLASYTLTELNATLSADSEFGSLDPAFKQVDSLQPGETTEIEWILLGENPGSGRISVSITSPDIDDVAVSRDVIVTRFTAQVDTDEDAYELGSTVSTRIAVRNDNPEVSYIDLVVGVAYEYQGLEDTYSIPVEYFSGLETRNFALAWDSSGKPAGAYNVTVYILRESRVMGEASTSFVLLSGDQPPVADAGGPYTGIEGAPVVFDGSGSYDPDGYMTLYEWDFTGDGHYDFNSLEPTASWTWVDDYAGSVTLRVTDNDGLIGTAMAEVTVMNAPPTVGNISAPADPVQVGTLATLSADFTDPGILDTHTAEWEWGDGTISEGDVLQLNGSGTVTGSHTYILAGDFLVTLTVTDKDGGSHSSSVTIHVADIDEALELLNLYIQDSDDSVFRGRAAQRKNAFGNVFSALQRMWVQQEYRGMIQVLRNHIRSKADGMLLIDPGRLNDDWITNREAQEHICQSVDDMIEYLEYLLGM